MNIEKWKINVIFGAQFILQLLTTTSRGSDGQPTQLFIPSVLNVLLWSTFVDLWELNAAQSSCCSSALTYSHLYNSEPHHNISRSRHSDLYIKSIAKFDAIWGWCQELGEWQIRVVCTYSLAERKQRINRRKKYTDMVIRSPRLLHFSATFQQRSTGLLCVSRHRGESDKYIKLQCVFFRGHICQDSRLNCWNWGKCFLF